MGDLIARKNYETSIRAVAALKNEKVKYYVCGLGQLLEPLKQLCRDLAVEKQVRFLGFRSDIKELLQAADIFLLTSRQEGLPRSLMEAMASSLPVIASKIRGNVDLIDDGEGGYLCDFTDAEKFAERINCLARDWKLRESMGVLNFMKIKEYDVAEISKFIETIYEDVLR